MGCASDEAACEEGVEAAGAGVGPLTPAPLPEPDGAICVWWEGFPVQGGGDWRGLRELCWLNPNMLSRSVVSTDQASRE